MNSLTLKLSIFFVVLASICLSAPIIDQTMMESELFDTTELVPRALEESNSIISISATTEKDGEEMTTISPSTSTKSSHDKESEGDESHETREVREFSEMNTSESPMYVTEKSTLYPRESSTTMKMISTSFSSSTVPQKYLGRLEDQNEPLEDIERSTKIVQKVTKKPMKYEEEEEQHQEEEPTKKVQKPMKHHEEEEQHREEEQPTKKVPKPMKHQEEEEHHQEKEQPTKKVQKPTEQAVQELEQEFPVTEESEVKGDYKVAEYDPKALESIATVESSRLQYDENNQSILYVPVESTTIRSSKEKDHLKLSQPIQKEKTLDQAQKSPVAEEEKSNH